MNSLARAEKHTAQQADTHWDGGTYFENAITYFPEGEGIDKFGYGGHDGELEYLNRFDANAGAREEETCRPRIWEARVSVAVQVLLAGNGLIFFLKLVHAAKLPNSVDRVYITIYCSLPL